ncbi:esterase [Tumebacillus algifaecis]|uniref:Esterase n=1 Tax=Tumebacillus algifaecis TaxID=1214604 RepID=A0A223CWJ0_9BACL|nr:alpha/beta hydrolase-fold protein [Tumebacillus algifaecis]ASS73682.1 esterase [Tumebacillus algifaecis]
MKRFRTMTVQGREVLVYLPPSYADTEQRYPVAYIHDRGELFTQSINYLEHLFLQKELPELILVGITPHHRQEDYTPWPAQSLDEAAPPFRGKGRDYVDEIADVLKPCIDEQYRTRPEAEQTAIAGASLGGLISLFAGYWRPETFGRIGLLSASFWYQGVLPYMREQEALAPHLRVFLSVGSCEGMYKQNAQQEMVQNTREAHDLLLAKGFPAEQLHMKVEPGGTHDALFMLQQFPDALRWLFAPPTRKSGERLGTDEGAIALGAYRLPRTTQWVMRAKRTGREYRIFIAVPSTPPPAQGYPVVYALDGNASFGSLTEAMRLQSRRQHGVTPAVIVSIGYDSEEAIVTDQRFYDYTVQADPSELPTHPGGAAWPTTGGAEQFLAFIEEELKPEVARQYPINNEQQALFGHSLGGFFTLYTLFTKPESFQHFIAGSPSVWWKEHTLLQMWPDLEKRLQQGAVQTRLLLAIGSEEKPSMVEDTKRLYRLLSPYQNRGLCVELQICQGEGHVSVIPPLISHMFRFLSPKQS